MFCWGDWTRKRRKGNRKRVDAPFANVFVNVRLHVGFSPFNLFSAFQITLERFGEYVDSCCLCVIAVIMA